MFIETGVAMTPLCLIPHRNDSGSCSTASARIFGPNIPRHLFTASSDAKHRASTGPLKKVNC